MIYGFLNQKGGGGKATPSVNLSMELTRRVLRFDADPHQP